MHKTIKLIPTILWGFFILFLTLKPKSHSGSSFPIWLENLHPDKIAHFTFWAIWYVIFDLTFLTKQSSVGNNALTNDTLAHKNIQALYFIGIATILGAIIELLQWKLNWGRSAEWLDLLCDFLGLVVIFMFCRRSARLK